MAFNIVSLLILVYLRVLGSLSWVSWDNTGYIFIYDDDRYRNQQQAQRFCSNQFDSRLATILSEDASETLAALDPFPDNSTIARECWIGLEYRLIDVYTPYLYYTPVYTEEVRYIFNKTINQTYPVNATVVLNLTYYELSDWLIENNFEESNDTYVLCDPISVSSSLCNEYNTAPDTITISNRSNGTHILQDETITPATNCYLEIGIKEFSAGLENEPEKEVKHTVCKGNQAFNYSNYIGYIWEDGSPLIYTNFYNYTQWNPRSPNVPTLEPTEPPSDINGNINWYPPTGYPTMAPTIWNESEPFCVSIDMITGQWFQHRKCSDGDTKFHCWVCDTNLDIRSNDDYVYHYDLTDDKKLSKTWEEANDFCKDNYKTKLASVRSKNNDISMMSLVYAMTGLNFSAIVDNITAEVRAGISNTSEEFLNGLVEQVVGQAYYEIEWLQNQNLFFRENRHQTQSVWLGMEGYIDFDESCYQLNFNNPNNGSYFNITQWNIDNNDNVTRDDIDREWIEENLLTNLEYCYWKLAFEWIDNSELNLSWVDFTVPARPDYPNITQYNWPFNQYYDDGYTPDQVSCVALYYNQSRSDWLWNLYPCDNDEDYAKIAWLCEAPERRFRISGDDGKSKNSHDNTNDITTSATLVACIFVFPITLFVICFCLKYYVRDKKGDFIIDCVDFIICTKCRSNYQRQKAAETGQLLTNNKKATDAGLAGWLGVSFTDKLSAVAAYAEETEVQEYLYEIHWPKEAQYWGSPSRLNSLEYFIRLSSKRTLQRVWKVFDEDNEDRIHIKDDWSRVMYCWLAMYLIEHEEDKVQPPPPFDRVRPIFDKISYELTHFLPKKEKEFMKKEDYMEHFKRWLYKICRRRQILLRRYKGRIAKERERLELDDPNRPKDSNSSDEEPPILWNPGSIIFSDIKAKNKKSYDNDNDDDDDEDTRDESNSKKDKEIVGSDYDTDDEIAKAKRKNEKLDKQFSTQQIVPVRKDISLLELQEIGDKKGTNRSKNNNNNNNDIDHEVAPVQGLDLEDLLLAVDDNDRNGLN